MKNNKLKKLLSISFLVISSFLIVNFSQAGILNSDLSNKMQEQTEKTQGAAGLSSDASVGSIVSTIINAALSLLAIIFVVLIIFSGYQWMTAGGNEDAIKKAQSRIKNAIIGLVIVLSAYAISAFIFSRLPFEGATQNTSEEGSQTTSE